MEDLSVFDSMEPVLTATFDGSETTEAVAAEKTIKHHLIFQNELKDSSSAEFVIRILNLDSTEAYYKAQGTPFDPEFLKVTYGIMKDLVRYPMETKFIATITAEEGNFSIVNTDHIHINKAKPLYYGSMIYYTPSGTGNPTQEEIVLGLEHIINFEVKGEDMARTVSKSYAAYGVKIDVEAIITPPAPELPKEGETGFSFKDYISKTYPVPNSKKTGFHIDPMTWMVLVRNVLRKENTLLIGPTGSGKTELLIHLAEAMGKKLHIQDMGTIQDAQSALLGVHRLNKEGHSEFDPAPFVAHIQDDAIVLLDELSRAPVSANNILFPCLDSRRYLPLDIACGDTARRVAVGENTVFFATANIGSEFSGTTEIDRALFDRFMPYELDYLSEKVEQKILQIRTGIPADMAKAIVKVSGEIRKQYLKQEIGNTVSIRHTLQTAGLISDGFDLNESLMYVMMPLFEDSIGGSERAKVKSIIAAY